MMRILQLVYDKHQLITVSDHRDKIIPHYILSISVQVGDMMLDVPNVVIDEAHPHYNNMVHNDYWDIWAINRVIEAQERSVFDLVMAMRLKGLSVTQLLAFTVLDTVYEFVPHPEGGLSEWENAKGKRKFRRRWYTIEDALNGMYRMWGNFDAWKIFDKKGL